jgi:peptidyl-prolyl cis-trans isomerase B (cyclophilin B)
VLRFAAYEKGDPMSRLAKLTAPVVIAALAALSCGDTAQAPAPAAPTEEIAVIQVRGLGEIRVRFFPDKAPGHVENFKKLARSGFYNGTTFHRVIPGFMIQGGDPNSKDKDPNNDGFGNPGYLIKAEFNDVPHKRGILSMARSANPDSAGSQFFICVADAPMLDGKYTVFGEVTAGMEVADKIVAVARNEKNRPLEDVVVETVTIEQAPPPTPAA